MAGWSELFESRPRKVSKQVFLCSGELSGLVWDRVNQGLSSYDFHYRVSKPGELGTPTMFGMESAYLVVDPSMDMLNAVENSIRSGSTESYFVLISGEVSSDMKPHLEFIKKKAQHSKHYYVISAPKTEQAQSKMESYFLMRWAVSRETSSRVCSIMEYSPGLLYLFDQQFLLCTDGRVLPSTTTKKLVDKILGTDTPNLVLASIVNGEPVDIDFDEDFTYKVLMFLHTTIQHARMIHSAWKDGNSTIATASKATGLTQYYVHRAWGLAESTNPQQLRSQEDLILYGLQNYSQNPEMLSVISHLWK